MPDDDAGGARTLCGLYELHDGIRHVLWIGRVFALKNAHERFEHLARNGSDFSVGFTPIAVARLLGASIHIRRIRTWLDEHDLDTKGSQLVAIAVGQRFDGVLRGSIESKERKSHSTQDRADIYHHPLPCLRRWGSVARSTRWNAKHVDLKEISDLFKG
ncbi:MAG: hypothetical protein WDO13_19045 [Verrucomicrobiota bacterium]